MARTFSHATPEERATARALQKLPDIGPAMAHDLMRLGIASAEDLATHDPDELYARLGALDGTTHDPCVLDTFMAAVDAARGLPARPWWEYTPLRKARGAGGTATSSRQHPGKHRNG